MKSKPIPFRSVAFSEMVKWLKRPRRVPTLGRRSYFDASSPNTSTILIVGKKGGQANLDRAYWDYVCEVIDRTAPDRRHIVKNYNQLKNYYFSPSVPALCRAFCEENGIKI